MHKYILSFIVLLLFSALSFAGNYNIDKAHSNIGFSVSHMVIADVEGEFTDYEVDLTFDQNNLSNFNVSTTIKIASVNTENEKRDGHLRSPDFFDAANNPEMTFTSSKVEKTKDGYKAHGTLTMRGVSKEIELPFKVKGPIKDNWGNTRIGVKASTVINRQDYGVKWDKTLDTGGLIAGNDVTILIDAEFIKAK